MNQRKAKRATAEHKGIKASQIRYWVRCYWPGGHPGNLEKHTSLINAQRDANEEISTGAWEEVWIFWGDTEDYYTDIDPICILYAPLRQE